MQSTAHVINIHDLITSFKKIFGEVVKNVLYFSTSVILHFSPTSFFIFHKYNLVIFSLKKNKKMNFFILLQTLLS